MIIKFFLYISLIIFNISIIFAQDEVYNRIIKTTFYEYYIDSNDFVKKIENEQLSVYLKNNENLTNFYRNNDENTFIFSKPFDKDYDYDISIKFIDNLCIVNVINSGGMVISNSFVDVWEISNGYYYLKYIERATPIKDNVIEFAFKPKTSTNPR
jgi:hypothetical protein